MIFLLFPFLLIGCQTLEDRSSEALKAAAETQIRRNLSIVQGATTTKGLILKAKRVIKNGLKDPESAKFRNVKIIKTKKGFYVCGQYDAKNSYGGYGGYVPFVSNGSLWAQCWDQQVGMLGGCNSPLQGREFSRDVALRCIIVSGQ